MARSTSAPIDRVHALVKALRESAEAVIEKAGDEQPGLWAWRTAADPQDSRRQFSNAYDAFVDGLDTMKAAIVELENRGYDDPDFCYLDATGREYFHAAGIQGLYVAVANVRHRGSTGMPGSVAHLLESLRPLEQALLKARAFCTAQEHLADEQGGPWSKPDSPGRWAKVFNVSRRTFIRYVDKKAILAQKLSDKSYQVALSDIPKPQESPPSGQKLTEVDK